MIKKYTRKCPKCGKVVFHSSIGSRSHCRNSICRQCSNDEKNRANYGQNNGNWKGFGEITFGYFNQVRGNAKKRNIPFDLTIEDMWKIFCHQNRKCIYTGVELQTPRRTRNGWTGNSSLDRIDSKEGYVKKNVQWVQKDINWMKQDFESSYFIDKCRQVVRKIDYTSIETPVDLFLKKLCTK